MNKNAHTKPLSAFLALIFAFTFSFTPIISYAQSTGPAYMNLPIPGAEVPPSVGFVPTLIKGITIDPQNALQFDFIFDTGNDELTDEEFEAEAQKLIKYFLAALTVPENEVWVNLSPYEEDQTIPESLGVTEMGVDLLAQDYLLKQLTATVINPEEDLGDEFWEKVYNKAYEQYGTTKIPINSFIKVWIVPDKATVWENNGNAFIVENRLKVMLEEDYAAILENLENKNLGTNHLKKNDVEKLNNVSSSVVREIVLPAIEQEVNEGKNFAQLRQVYNSIILAYWYKNALRDSLLGQIYIDQNKTAGVDISDKTAKLKIFDRYVQALTKGVYDFQRDDFDANTQKTIRRRYFSGGVTLFKVQQDPVTGEVVSSPLSRELAQASSEIMNQPISQLSTVQREAVAASPIGNVKIVKARFNPEQAASPVLPATDFSRASVNDGRPGQEQGVVASLVNASDRINLEREEPVKISSFGESSLTATPRTRGGEKILELRYSGTELGQPMGVALYEVDDRGNLSETPVRTERFDRNKRLEFRNLSGVNYTLAAVDSQSESLVGRGGGSNLTQPAARNLQEGLVRAEPFVPAQISSEQPTVLAETGEFTAQMMRSNVDPDMVEIQVIPKRGVALQDLGENINVALSDNDVPIASGIVGQDGIARFRMPARISPTQPLSVSIEETPAQTRRGLDTPGARALQSAANTGPQRFSPDDIMKPVRIAETGTANERNGLRAQQTGQNTVRIQLDSGTTAQPIKEAIDVVAFDQDKNAIGRVTLDPSRGTTSADLVTTKGFSQVYFVVDRPTAPATAANPGFEGNKALKEAQIALRSANPRTPAQRNASERTETPDAVVEIGSAKFNSAAGTYEIPVTVTDKVGRTLDGGGAAAVAAVYVNRETKRSEVVAMETFNQRDTATLSVPQRYENESIEYRLVDLKTAGLTGQDVAEQRRPNPSETVDLARINTISRNPIPEGTTEAGIGQGKIGFSRETARDGNRQNVSMDLNGFDLPTNTVAKLRGKNIYAPVVNGRAEFANIPKSEDPSIELIDATSLFDLNPSKSSFAKNPLLNELDTRLKEANPITARSRDEQTISGNLIQGSYDVRESSTNPGAKNIQMKFRPTAENVSIFGIQNAVATLVEEDGRGNILRVAAVAPINRRAGGQYEASFPDFDLSRGNYRVKLGNTDLATPKTKGGIDLNPYTVDFQVRKEDGGIQIPAIDPEILNNIKIDGITPVIMNITPVTSIPMYLSENERYEGDQSRLSARY